MLSGAPPTVSAKYDADHKRFDYLAFEVGCHVSHDLFHARQVFSGEDVMPIFGYEDQMCVEQENTVSAGAKNRSGRP